MKLYLTTIVCGEGDYRQYLAPVVLADSQERALEIARTFVPEGVKIERCLIANEKELDKETAYCAPATDLNPACRKGDALIQFDAEDMGYYIYKLDGFRQGLPAS